MLCVLQFIVFIIIFAAEFNVAAANSVFDFCSNFAKDLRVESTCLTTLPIHHIHCGTLRQNTRVRVAICNYYRRISVPTPGVRSLLWQIFSQ